MVVNGFVPGFPTERHNYMLINHCGRCYYPAFLVAPLIKRVGNRPDFLFDNLFVTRTTVVALNPRFLRPVPVNHRRDGYGCNVRIFVRHFHICNKCKQYRLHALCFLVEKQIVGLIHVIRCGKQQVVALVGNVNVCAGTNVRAVIGFFDPRFERLVQSTLGGTDRDRPTGTGGGIMGKPTQ